MPRGNGGVLGPANIPTTSVAKGVWSLMEQQLAQRQGIWPIVLSSDPYFEYTTLLLPGNGTNGAQNNTFLDGSTNNFTITRNGNTTQGTFSPFSQTGWGNYFDGSGDYLSAATNAAFNFGTGDATVEFWFNAAGAQPGSYPGIVSSSDYITSGSASIRYSNTGYSQKIFMYLNGGGDPVIASASTIAYGVWTHVAIVRQGTSLKLYLNGTQDASVTISAGLGFNLGNGELRVGRGFDVDGVGGYFYGSVSNLRLVKGTAVYTGNFTPPTSPLTAISGTSLLTCQSNRFRDASSNNFTITRNGDTSVVAFSPFNPSASWSAATYGGSGYFDGNGDYLTTPDNVAFTVGSGNWTLEAWVYPTASPNQPIIFGQWSGGTDGSVAMMLSNDGNRYLRGLVYSGGYVDRISGSSLQLNAWNHCAFVREGTFLNLYLNGSRVDNYSFGSGSVQDSSLVVSAGAASSGIQPFQGYITDCRFLKGTAQYTGATYTVPTAPLTAITNTSLLLNFTNAGIYDATSKNDLETVGNAQISTTQSKWGGSSIYLDGTGDYLFSKYSTLYDLGGGDFTIETWVYFSSLPSNNYVTLLSYGNSVSAQRFLFYYDTRTSQSSPGLRFSVLNASNSLLVDVNGGGTSGWSANTWYHISITRSGSSFKLFRDGVQNGSTVTDTDSIVDVTANGLYVGVEPNGSSAIFTGYMQDLRITKGYARYTANFTAPTAAFPTL